MLKKKYNIPKYNEKNNNILFKKRNFNELIENL
jgi:hypothetical protein